MSRVMKDKRAYWIGGTVTALLGVALVRLVAPELTGIAGSLTMALGYALVVAGITIISCATRRKKSEAFITVEKNAKDRKRP
jgi:hypothetical protein